MSRIEIRGFCDSCEMRKTEGRGRKMGVEILKTWGGGFWQESEILIY